MRSMPSVFSSARGYTIDNLVLASKAANQARGNADPADFKRLIREIKRN